MTCALEKLVNASPWLLGQERGWNDGLFLHTKIVGSGNILGDSEISEWMRIDIKNILFPIYDFKVYLNFGYQGTF